MADGSSELTEWRVQLKQLNAQLRRRGADRDPVLWAAVCSLESASDLLDAYQQQSADAREAYAAVLLAAVGSARAAVGAATYAAQAARRV